jgi:hypothetical protein
MGASFLARAKTHEAIGEYFNIKCFAVFPEPGQVRLTILVDEENILAPVTSLRDVMRNTGKYRSGLSGHGGSASQQRVAFHLS